MPDFAHRQEVMAGLWAEAEDARRQCRRLLLGLCAVLLPGLWDPVLLILMAVPAVAMAAAALAEHLSARCLLRQLDAMEAGR